MKIQNFEQNTLTLENFEGPLSFLLYLVQRHEIELSDIPVLEITTQYLQYLEDTDLHDLNAGAEFIDTTSLLIRLKSKLLLPVEKEEERDISEDYCPFDIIPTLIEYCQFKDVARNLAHREQGEENRYTRGLLPTVNDFPKPLGIERIRLEELEELFVSLLRKSEEKKELIPEETWRVSDKISTLREILRDKKKIKFSEVFQKIPCRIELIVTFLGLLELMKLGEIEVIRFPEEESIYLCQNLNNKRGTND